MMKCGVEGGVTALRPNTSTIALISASGATAKMKFQLWLSTYLANVALSTFSATLSPTKTYSSELSWTRAASTFGNCARQLVHHVAIGSTKTVFPAKSAKVKDAPVRAFVN